MQRQARVEKDFVLGYTNPVYNPHSLPMFKTTPVNNKKGETRRLRQDPVATQLPYLPKQGPQTKGRIATTHNVVQSIIQSYNEDVEKVDDARVQILQLNNYTSKHQ